MFPCHGGVRQAFLRTTPRDCSLEYSVSDSDEVDEGDVIVCDECGAEFEIVGTDPLELSKVDNEGYESEDSLALDEEEE